MATVKLVSALLLILSSAAIAVNDFSGDPNCVAVYRFENGALTVDSQGSNDLTASASAPVADTVRYKEGAASVDIEKDDLQYYYCEAAGQDSEFPCAPGTSGDFSVTGWLRWESLPGSYSSRYILAKGSLAGTDLCFNFQVYNSNPPVAFRLGFDTGSGSSVQYYATTMAVSSATWYHFGISRSNTTKVYIIHIWDGATTYTFTGSDKYNINREASRWYVGTWQNSAVLTYDGLIDELTVWNRALTTDEMDKIRQGTYTGAGSKVIRLVEY